MSHLPVTVGTFKEVLPKKLKRQVNQTLMDQINATIDDPVILEAFKDNLIGFTSVLTEGKFTMAQYICAVKYASYKLMGATNKDAYLKTFPGKYSDFVTRGVSAKDISSYSTAYNKTKLVNLIMAQTLIPVHVLNAPMFQQALNVQAELMLGAKSEMVRSNAATALLTHLRPPEAQEIELSIAVKEDDSIKALRESTLALVAQQKEMIRTGSASVTAIAESNLLIANNTEEAEIVDG